MRCILALFPGHRQAACRGPQSLQEHGKHDPYGPQRAQIMLHLRQDCLIQPFKGKKMSLLVYVGASKRLVIMHKSTDTSDGVLTAEKRFGGSDILYF